MTLSASTLLVPGEDASWRVWKPRASNPSEAVETPSDYGDRSKPVVVGLPATACRTLGLLLPQADAALLQEMVSSQLERRGIKGPNGEAPTFRWHQLGHSGPNVIVSVDVLVEPFPMALVVPHAVNYASAMRLTSLPPGQIVIAEEQGDLIIVAGHQGRLFHSHVFTQRPADAESLAQEILLTRLGLESTLGSGTVSGVTLVGQWDADVVADLRRTSSLPVLAIDRLAPSQSIDTKNWTTLLPRSVSDARAAAATKRRYIGIAFVVAAAYAAAIVLGFLYLQARQLQANNLAEEVAKTSAPAAEVRATADRWKAFAADIESRRYPMVTLSQITALMPPSGINLREFDHKGESLEIRAYARDLQTASQWKEDMEKHKDLGRYTWTMPQPVVINSPTAGNITSLRLQGKLKP